MQLQYSLARVDLPLLLRLMAALMARDTEALAYWNSTVLACRESRELLLTDTAMGEALLRLLRQLEVPVSWPVDLQVPQASFVTAFALASHAWQIAPDSACLGLCWSWLENQVAAATKLVPLGQSQAQRLLGELQQQVPEAINLAKILHDHELGGSLPALAIASSWHETQYSRLFRS
jgi:urease accessory protein